MDSERMDQGQVPAFGALRQKRAQNLFFFFFWPEMRPQAKLGSWA